MSGSFIELDRECLLSNLETFRLRLGKRALMAVVKANAYGHGARLIAPVIRDHVDWFAVDALAEAEGLREYEKPILILGHTDVVSRSATSRSYAACRFIQNSDVLPK